jgi:hypothetical protein
MPKPTKQRKEMKLVIKLGVASLATAVLLAGCAHRESASLPTRWGTVENPSGICKVTWTNQAWHMELPGGIFDLSPYQRPDNLAPRVLQSVAGDFVAEVKVTGDFDPGTLPVMPGRAAFFGAGLLLWESPTNYVRLERNEWTYGPARPATRPVVRALGREPEPDQQRHFEHAVFPGRLNLVAAATLERRGHRLLPSRWRGMAGLQAGHGTLGRDCPGRGGRRFDFGETVCRDLYGFSSAASQTRVMTRAKPLLRMEAIWRGIAVALNCLLD